MSKDIHEGLLLDNQGSYTFAELHEITLIEEGVLIEMIEFGIVEPSGSSQQNWIFTHYAVLRTQKALRLHQDLAINWQGVSLALELLDEIAQLRELIKVNSQI